LEEVKLGTKGRANASGKGRECWSSQGMLEVLCLSARFVLCGGLVLNIHNLEVFVNTETMYTFSISRDQ
jgi:hypothetical protein